MILSGTLGTLTGLEGMLHRRRARVLAWDDLGHRAAMLAKGLADGEVDPTEAWGAGVATDVPPLDPTTHDDQCSLREWTGPPLRRPPSPTTGTGRRRWLCRAGELVSLTSNSLA